MAAAGKVMKWLCYAAVVAVVLQAVAVPEAEAALDCGSVFSYLKPCLSYLTTKQGSVSGSCCNGVKGLYRAAKTTKDRQAACKCLLSAAGGANISKAAAIPKKCRINIPYKISTSTNCSKVK